MWQMLLPPGGEPGVVFWDGYGIWRYFVVMIKGVLVWFGDFLPTIYPGACRGQSEHRFLHQAAKMRLKVSRRAGTLGKMDSLPSACYQRLYCSASLKLFDLLSVQASNQQKLDHFSACPTSAQPMLLSGFVCEGVANQAEKLFNFLFNRKCLKSHKSRAENSKNM